ncbi:MAG: cell division protein FtsA [Candidatus Chisholmbacteria bacterium RIFCSPHIGHO2_01_FULL_48_12]|uniref:Cell division protein FtsA n=1 Tax=Candidatus Chisholmbacteria bacterium RIFCSPHIGHO2_01_FULL_48_12 TaxID=1797589 RepID=A0A1G1VQ51_9BACT|nr:MAG: cell division protein FtsA [Candidatus Chisholmbacteria bacterium RIFCSPHIGHO2_01_FULL_48_12]
MAKGRILAGIDIGSSKVVTLIASQAENLGKINCVGVAAVESRGLRKSQIVDIEEATDAITESVEAAERMAGYSISHAFVSIGGAHIQSQNSKGVVAVAQPESEITATDVDRVIEAARAVSLPSAREILHVIPRDFVVDSQAGIKDPIGMTGVRLETEAHLITASSTAIKNLVRCVNDIGVAVAGVVFSGLAASESALSDTEKELGVVLLDIGGGSTSMSVFVDSALSYSAVIPIGAKNITNDLAIGMRVSLETAEIVKLALSTPKATAALPDKTDSPKSDDDAFDLSQLNLKEEVSATSKKTLIEGIIRPRLNEIFTLAGLELKQSNLGGQTPAGVVLVGGGALTVGIETACKRTLSLPTRIGHPQGLSGLVEEIGSPAFASATGLILYAASTAAPGSATPLNKVSRLIDKLPVRGAVNKAIDFIKSFLP